MRLALTFTAALAVMAAACAPYRIPASLDPAHAADAVSRTAPDGPVRLVFDWRAIDGEARFNGRGVARIEPPYRARLDLFGPRGDTYLVAALVEDRLRLPPGLQAGALPPPALMWAALGVVAPPPDALLVGTRERGVTTELYYELGDAVLRYVLEAGRLRSAALDGPGRRMLVEIRGQVAGFPAQALFRDRAAGTELMLNVETVDEVEPYPPDIWTPGR